LRRHKTLLSGMPVRATLVVVAWGLVFACGVAGCDGDERERPGDTETDNDLRSDTRRADADDSDTRGTDADDLDTRSTDTTSVDTGDARVDVETSAGDTRPPSDQRDGVTDSGDVVDTVAGCGGSSVVELASTDPIYTMDDIPFSFAQSAPFQDVHYLPAGYFVVAGDLNINVSVGSQGTWLGAGQYVFDEDGGFVGQQHIAYDARGQVPTACGEGVHFQSTSVDIVSASSFVRTPSSEATDGQVFELPPLLYDVSANGVSLQSKPTLTPTGNNDCQLERNYRNTAVVGDTALVIEESYGGPPEGDRNVMLSLPGFDEVGETTVVNCAGQPAPAVTPYLAVGDLVLARTHEYSDTNPVTGNTLPCTDVGGLDLYAFQSSSLERVHRLFEPNEYIRESGGDVEITEPDVTVTAVDATNPRRVAIAVSTPEGQVVMIVSVANDGSVSERVVDIPGVVLGGRVALSGPYLAAVTTTGDLYLEEDGVELTVPAPPPDQNGIDNLFGIGLSASGTMLLGQRSQLALYRITCP